MRWAVVLIALLVWGCVPAPQAPRVLGNPAFDADGDGQTPDGGDCDDADPHRFSGAPELCDARANGCGEWAPEDEAGAVSWEADGRWSSVTDAWSAGAAGAPPTLELPAAGTVHVCAGTYDVLLVDPPGGTVANVVGREGRDRTVLDGGGVGSVVVVNDPASALVLRGVTLTGGVDQRSGDGGGVSLLDGALALVDCRVSGNRGTNGGGVHAAGALVLERTEVLDNEATEDGGGVYALGDVRLSGCLVSANRASVHGGGVALVGAAVALLQDTSLVANQAAQGGGLWADAEVALEAGEVRDNTAAGFNAMGGGLAVFRGSVGCRDTAWIDNSAVVGASAALLVTGWELFHGTACTFDGAGPDVFVQGSGTSHEIGAPEVFLCDGSGCTCAPAC